MYADRSNHSKPNPASLAAAVTINGALVAALLFSSPEIIDELDRPFNGFNVPIVSPPPPPPPPPPQPERRSATPTRDPVIVTPRPEVPPPPSDNRVAGTSDPQPPIPFDPGPPAAGTGVTVDPPLPAPVLVDAAPDPRAMFQPDYPPSERRSGIEGNVTVRVLIGADGRVKAVEQVRAASPAFFDATRRQALSRWRFRPATRDGVPVESWRTMTVRFVLQG